MSSQIISFKTGPSRSGNGYPLPDSCEIPSVDGADLSLLEMIQKLDATLESLAKVSCSFWACEGPDRLQDMVTCLKCWAMREIAAVRSALAHMMEYK